MTTFELRRGNVLLGVLRECDVDQPWFICAFDATAAFEEVRPLFDDLLRATEGEGDVDVDAWERAYDRIAGLGLRLVPTDGEGEIDEFLLHVEGQEVRFRY